MGDASRTALLVAAYRARASEGDDPLCVDPWAGALTGEEGAAIANAMSRIQPQMELWVATRTAFIDSVLVALLDSDLFQVVVLGAGLDTRASRLSREGVRYFEVDTKASARDKRERLERLDGYPLSAATYVDCDFEREDFIDRLVASGFDAQEPAVVIWEGVSYYLSEQAARATLARVAGGLHPRSVLLFDHVGQRLVERVTKSDEDRSTLDLLAGLGEPFRFGSNDSIALVYEAGFRRARVTSFDEACLNLTGTYARERKFRFQWLVEASVERELRFR